MKEIKSKSFALLVIGLLWLGIAKAQESSNASGGNSTGSGGSVAYSIGQIVYTTNTSSSGTVEHGVQRAYEISKVGITETDADISRSVFPNPTVDNLTLQVCVFNKEQLSYQLSDLQGNLLYSDQIVDQLTQVITSSLPPATYFVNVLNQKNQKIQTFKFIKF